MNGKRIIENYAAADRMGNHGEPLRTNLQVLCVCGCVSCRGELYSSVIKKYPTPAADEHSSPLQPCPLPRRGWRPQTTGVGLYYALHRVVADIRLSKMRLEAYAKSDARSSRFSSSRHLSIRASYRTGAINALKLPCRGAINRVNNLQNSASYYTAPLS